MVESHPEGCTSIAFRRVASSLPEDVQALADSLTADAKVVWLAGSWARGDNARYSDVDLGVITDQPPELRRVAVGNRLVSVSFVGEAATLSSFVNPASAGAAVPGWRSAILLFDPIGLGATIQEQARQWTWEQLEPHAVPWLRKQAPIAVELLLKMLNARERHDPIEEARQRAAMIECLVRTLSVHHRVLFDSESMLYREVSRVMPPTWADHVAMAFSSPPANFAAALALFELVAAALEPTMDAPAQAVLRLAKSLAATAVGDPRPFS